MQLVWWPSGFTCKCRHTDCIVITVPIVNRAVCLITFRFHTQISSHWLLYCRSTQCQLSSHSDDISVSHENVIILTAFIVTANFIILETPPPHQKNEKKKQNIHTHTIINNAFSLMAFRVYSHPTYYFIITAKLAMILNMFKLVTLQS